MGFRHSAFCLVMASLLLAAGCRQSVFPAGAPEVISDFGSRIGVSGHPRRSVHRGIDIKGHYGQEVLAAADGRVLEAVVDRCWGPTVAVDHGVGRDGKRIVALYGHVGEILVATGDMVARGQAIARMGSNHLDFDCFAGVLHLHFQIGRVHRKHGKGNHWGHGYFLEDGYRSVNPHKFWADGPYQVTCFDPDATYPWGTLTYPVACD